VIPRPGRGGQSGRIARRVNNGARTFFRPAKCSGSAPRGGLGRIADESGPVAFKIREGIGNACAARCRPIARMMPNRSVAPCDDTPT
jgi:hypothetical protein